MSTVPGDKWIVCRNSRMKDPDATFNRFAHILTFISSKKMCNKEKEYRLMSANCSCGFFHELEALIPRYKSHLFNAETAWPSKGARDVAPGRL